MRRDVPAVRPILRCAFAFGLAALGVARAETVDLRYELSVSGIGVADMAVAVTLEGNAYSAQAKGATFGAAAMFDDLKIDARGAGRLAPGAVTPESFGTDNVLNGSPRRARVTWSPGGEASVQELHPTLAEEERTPIPDDARQGSLDPISGLMAFALGAPAAGTCSGAAKIFDGRRSYTLALSPDADGVTYVRLKIGDAEIVALKCAIQSQRTGGASPDSWVSSSGEVETASIWFWRDPKGRAVPVRVEADAAIGYAVGELARLP
jgi:hypothetical protein